MRYRSCASLIGLGLSERRCILAGGNRAGVFLRIAGFEAKKRSSSNFKPLLLLQPNLVRVPPTEPTLIGARSTGPSQSCCPDGTSAEKNSRRCKRGPDYAKISFFVPCAVWAKREKWTSSPETTQRACSCEEKEDQKRSKKRRQTCRREGADGRSAKLAVSIGSRSKALGDRIRSMDKARKRVVIYAKGGFAEG